MFKQQLINIVNSVNSRVIGQTIKSKKHIELYQWLLKETELLVDVPIAERVYYVINDKPNLVCDYGNRKVYSQKRHDYKFCGNVKDCTCFREWIQKNPPKFDPKAVVEKRKITWSEKYGVDNPSKNKLVQEKRQTTMQSKDYSKVWKRLKLEKETNGYDQVVKRLKGVVAPEFTRENYHGCFRKNFYLWKCDLCGSKFEDHVDYGRVPRCGKCNPKSVSRFEIEIREYLNSIGVDFVANTKTILGDLEYDIYSSTAKIAVEANGVYWHSSIKKSPKYHVDKFIRSRNAGIKLIQIFEDEWHSKQAIVKSRLRSVFRVGKRIYARKCQIVDITREQYRLFLLENHLQGYASASYKYGLIFDGQLVAVMSFGKSRYTDTGFELIRYCSIDNIVGGASRLFRHFIKQVDPDLVISYANRCWSDGNLYRKLGFVDVTQVDDNVGYWYVKDNTRYHRSTFIKSRLVLQGADKNKTEEDIMSDLGYLKIYDCGNYKFEWKKQG